MIMRDTVSAPLDIMTAAAAQVGELIANRPRTGPTRHCRALHAAVPMAAGDTFRAEFNRLGTVEARVVTGKWRASSAGRIGPFARPDPHGGAPAKESSLVRPRARVDWITTLCSLGAAAGSRGVVPSNGTPRLGAELSAGKIAVMPCGRSRLGDCCQGGAHGLGTASRAEFPGRIPSA